MAVVAKTEAELRIPLPSDRKVSVWTWGPMANGDTGDPLEVPEAADRSVQFGGTFDTSVVVLEGSNDGVTYFTLTDPQGNNISKNGASLEQVEEVCRYARPRCVSGGANT